MLFYKVTCINADFNEDIKVSREELRQRHNEINQLSSEFDREDCDNSCFFAVQLDMKSIRIGVIIRKDEGLRQRIDEYLGCINFNAESVDIAEITIETLENLLEDSVHNRLIEDGDTLLRRFSLNKLYNWRHFEFGENLIGEIERDEAFANAEKYLYRETLISELERIYADENRGYCYGHPVHYMISEDDKDTRKGVYRLLLQALYSNNRIKNRRYAFTDFNVNEPPCEGGYMALYEASVGGTVVIRFSDHIRVVNNNGDLCGGALETVCRIIKKYRNRVLTVFCLPRECERLKEVILEYLGSITMVEIHETPVCREDALIYLKNKAPENGIELDGELIEMLEEGIVYTSEELDLLLDEWYSSKLKSKIYPQYEDYTQPTSISAKSAPIGSAYDELQSMIGLSSAKEVIQKALNYYKIQKLFERRGIKRDSPAMHMVFSGNPGTAKTTVARLFTRIMKDNGLISKGELIEVGRSDLVGRYVGWTAKTVKARFNAAIGGVLFIDEAYSLLDANSGSFGDEAINTIVQEMENHREDVVVILAGYPDKMEELISRNPGLRSRIAFHVPFEDYSKEELCDIAALIGERKGVYFDDEAMQKLEGAFEVALRQGDFGNGRYVRNILEQARMNQASRLLEYNFEDITLEEITTIKAVDITVPEIKREEKRVIGFVG